MNMKLWNLVAEVLGFGSGVLLLLPAISLNSFLREAEDALKSFEEAKQSFGKRIGEVAAPALEKARIPKWSERDQWMMKAGAALLALSFLIKFFVVWNSPG